MMRKRYTMQITVRDLKWLDSQQKIGVKVRKMTRDNQGYIIWIKGSIRQEDITILSACTPKTEPQITLSKKIDRTEKNNRQFNNNKYPTLSS